MQIFHFNKISELRRTEVELEKKLNVKITTKGKKVTINSDNELDEYEASIILDAINFGFSTQKALLIKEQEMLFRIISIKDFTRKKNLREVRARIIGRQGKTRKTIEQILNCHIIIKNNEIGIIGDTESIEELITAIKSLIRGTKQSHTYRYLEKVRTQQKHNKRLYYKINNNV